MHITARCRHGLPSFRQQRVGKIVLRQMRRLNDETFQIVHFSIQTNHVHLVVEARDRKTIARKMAGFMISFAKLLNGILGRRKGKVWIDRYYRRDIVGGRDMNAVLRYVFGNAKRHGLIPAEATVLDPYSTAWTFDGWKARVPPLPSGGDHWPRPKPRTRILAKDWIAWGGLLPLDRRPGPRP